jgi:membrane protein implicated in regulation of membrane protease activity
MKALLHSQAPSLQNQYDGVKMSKSELWYSVLVSSICELIVIGVIAFVLILFYLAYFLYILLGAIGVVILYLSVKHHIYKPLFIKPTQQPRDEIIGQVGVVITDLAPRGQIKLRNEIWSGRSDSGTIRQGMKVKVVNMDGIQLIVQPLQDSERR